MVAAGSQKSGDSPPCDARSAELRQALGAAVGAEGEVRFDEPLHRHTTLRIGGPADVWIAPDTIDCLRRIRALCYARGVATSVLGAGSNLLVRDGGVRGVVLSSDRLRRLDFGQPAEPGGAVEVYVEAGVTTGKLLSQATRRDLGGVEFLGGVPGSIGGGLVMNAGTYLGEFKDVTTAVDSVAPDGTLVHRPAAECGFVYRGSALPRSEVIVAGYLRLPPRPRAEIEVAVRALRDRRKQREPHGFPNAGSFFKNPPGDFAGRLIEAAGLKGTQVGSAQVAQAHANWILNVADGPCGSARDTLQLIEQVRQAVQQKFGVQLELEVRLLGEDPA